MTQLRLMQPAEVVDRWGDIRKLLDRAVQHTRGELVVDDILSLVGKGKMGVFALEDGDELQLCSAFEVITYPRMTVMNLAFAGGRNGASLAEHFGVVDAVAKEMGATVVRCQCRPAVARRIKYLMPDAQDAYVVVERKVKP